MRGRGEPPGRVACGDRTDEPRQRSIPRLAERQLTHALSARHLLAPSRLLRFVLTVLGSSYKTSARCRRSSRRSSYRTRSRERTSTSCTDQPLRHGHCVVHSDDEQEVQRDDPELASHLRIEEREAQNR